MPESLTEGARRRRRYRSMLMDLAEDYRVGDVSFMQFAPAVESIVSAFTATYGQYFDQPVYGQAMEFEILYARMLDQNRRELTDDEKRRVAADLDILLGMMSREPGDDMPEHETVMLYRPVGPRELALIEASGWRAFPPRLPEQPIFYPVTNEPYAAQIARDWNSKSAQNGNVGYVTRFQVRASHLAGYRVEQVGSRQHQEYWIPAAELALFNQNIVGLIEVIGEYRHGEHVDRSA
jgi:hypothetical protein